jgi:oligoribonuclease NrnB/cAMP/cGMP phosphodiesterase (DHH superfamily)
MKKIIILYDGSNCSDGFGGAWAAWKKFSNRAQYIGVLYENPPPKGLKNKEIYMIDFTYPAATIKKLIKENKRVTTIDHHISAEKAAKLTQNYSFSLNHSGCVLAWKYFHPHKPVPILLKYIEDIDLWKFQFPHTKEIFEYHNLFNFDFKTWDKIATDLENPKIKNEYVKKGGIILKYQNKLIEQLVKNNAELVRFEGYKTFAVNSPLFNSQLGHILVKKLPPIGIIWKKRADSSIYVSLRSNGKADVAKIAEKFGGGGHKAAAAFSLPSSRKLPWHPIKS